MSKILDFYHFMDEIAPFSKQEPWDNSGFLVGDGEKEVKKVLVALDATLAVLEEAEKVGVELIITHHPVIFRAMKEIHPDSIAFLAAQKGIGIISSHTCLDVAENGVSDCLAMALELSDIQNGGDELGVLRVGKLKKPLSCEDFVAYVAEKLKVGGIKYIAAQKPIRTVAVCGGAGEDFFEDAIRVGADAYVTGNIKHSFWIEMKRKNFCVLDAGHFATENPAMEPLAKRLAEHFSDTEILLSKDSADPAEYWAK